MKTQMKLLIGGMFVLMVGLVIGCGKGSSSSNTSNLCVGASGTAYQGTTLGYGGYNTGYGYNGYNTAYGATGTNCGQIVNGQCILNGAVTSMVYCQQSAYGNTGLGYGTTGLGYGATGYGYGGGQCYGPYTTAWGQAVMCYGYNCTGYALRSLTTGIPQMCY